MPKIETALGIIGTTIAEEHIFTFMLSSPFTARNLAKEKGDIEGVKTDLNISLIFSIAFSILIAYLLKDYYTALWGSTLALIMYYVYLKRGELI